MSGSFMLLRGTALLLLLWIARAGDGAPADDPPPIDWDRARQLHQRDLRGEKLSDQDRAYLERARAARRAGQGARPGSRPAGQPSTAPAGPLTPLCDLAGEARYKGLAGGLYGDGRNDPPEAHAKAAMKESAKIVPLDGDGKPAAGGKVAMMSIGMSNTTQEFSRFVQLAQRDPDKSPSLVIVDAAQGGRDAADWADADRGKAVWAEADRRLAASGGTPQQVQVVWIKQALKGPARLGEFPDHARQLQRNLADILVLAKSRYPNLRLAYLSSRTYAGYAATPLNPEPHAFESAFSVRWVIEQQLKGDVALNWDQTKGPVRAPLVLWGPYLWADGPRGRKTDDLLYRREDFAPDGTHPSDSGRQKVADLLLRFFRNDPTSKGWFMRPDAGAAK